MIRNVVFDIGAVLIGFDWEAYLKTLFPDAGIRARLTAAMWENPDWNALDRGLLPFEDVVQLFVENDPGIAAEIREALEHLGEAPVRQSYAVPWISELKEMGLSVYYLSNYFVYLMRKAPGVLDFIPHTDGGIFSCELHVTKPEPEIYRALFSRYGILPEESVFVDDSPRNVAAAEALGMKAFRFTEYRETYPQVMDFLRGIDNHGTGVV